MEMSPASSSSGGVLTDAGHLVEEAHNPKLCQVEEEEIRLVVSFSSVSFVLL